MKTFGAFFILSTAFAANASQNIVVSSFQLWATTSGSDAIRVIPVGVVASNADGCTDPDSYMVSTALPSSSISRIYSTLLAAKTIGKPIRLVTSGCQSNRPAIVDAILD